jgi:hypothetical protein
LRLVIIQNCYHCYSGYDDELYDEEFYYEKSEFVGDKRVEAVKNIYDTLKSLKLYKFYGEYLKEDEYNKTIDEYELFKEFIEIKENVNECMVCLDKIYTDIKNVCSGEIKNKLKCGHIICVCCLNQLRQGQTCPMCRACICCGTQERHDE